MFYNIADMRFAMHYVDFYTFLIIAKDLKKKKKGKKCLRPIICFKNKTKKQKKEGRELWHLHIKVSLGCVPN